MDLSANLRAIVSQRLVRREDGKGRSAAIEILLNTPTLAEKIFNGEFHEIKTIMSRSRELGMCTFDARAVRPLRQGLIGFDEALRNADSTNELRLNIKLKSKRGEPQAANFCRSRSSRDPRRARGREAPGQAEGAGGAAQARGRAARALREKKRLAEASAQKVR